MAKSTTAYRSVRKSHFTQISNDLLNDNSLSLEAKGLLSIFLSNTDEWDLHMREIIKRSKNGRDAHYTALKKLIKAGYIARLEFKQISNNQFINLEYIFSDNKEDIANGIQDAQKFANDNEQFIVLTYKDIDSHRIESSIDNLGKRPFTEIPDTEANSEISPFTEIPDTENPNTENPDTESQYINNTKGINTNLNKNNINDMNDMNDKKFSIQQSHTNHTNHNTQQFDDESIKYLELQEFPELLKGYLTNFNIQDLQTIKTVILKSKKSFNNSIEIGMPYRLEDIEHELLSVLKRFKARLIQKNETVVSMQGYLMQSIKTELEEMHSLKQRQASF